MPKKKTALTIEERLQQALVPEAEQPYEIPQNWVWCRLGAVAEVKGGKRLPKGMTFSEKVTAHPYIRVTDFSDNGISLDELKYIDDKVFEKISRYTISTEDVYISIAGSIGKVGIIPKCMDGANLTENAAKITNIQVLDKKYLYLFLKSEFAQFQMKTSTIAITQSKLALFKIESITLPLSPVNEQQRIVNRIEKLFAKLDEAKEKLQEVVDGFAVRKAAILHKAFTGELTKKWRVKNWVSDDSWEERTLDSVCKSIFDGDHMPPPKSERGIPFLVISNVNTGYLSFEKCRFVSEEYYNALSETRTPENGDILYTIVGSYGIPVMVDTDKKFCFQRHIALLKPEKVYNRFLWYQLQTQKFFAQATEIATGTAQLTVPIKGLRRLIVVCPPETEQHEIVRLIDSLLERERRAQQAAEEALANIELLKKSILARAFRGELGTNRAEEESALELLKRTLAEK